MKLGVIADDFTGATDIAGFLVEYGIPTIQINGMPAPALNRCLSGTATGGEGRTGGEQRD